MSEGPFLYDDDPAPLHTGTPRSSTAFVVALLAGTAVVAVGFVLALFVVRGSPAEQSEEAVGVFLAALEQGDGETTHALLCEDVRATTEQGQVPPQYRVPLPAEVVGSAATELAGASAYEVDVLAADGSTTSFTVIREEGPRICGVSAPD